MSWKSSTSVEHRSQTFPTKVVGGVMSWPSNADRLYNSPGLGITGRARQGLGWLPTATLRMASGPVVAVLPTANRSFRLRR